MVLEFGQQKNKEMEELDEAENVVAGPLRPWS